MKEKNKMTQAELEASELKYRKIFQTAQEGVLLWDAATGQILDANPFLLELLHYSLPELLAKRAHDFGMPPEMMGTGGANEAGRGSSRSLVLKTKEGHDLPAEMICVRYPLGERTVVQCSIRNAAGRKLMEANIKRLTDELQGKVNELDTARKALQKLEELKSEFVSVVSHELRTPLATMQEFTAIILDEIPGKLTKEQKQYLHIIKENMGRLMRLITNLLDMSNLEAGKIELKKTLLDLGELAAGVLATFRAQAGEKHIELNARLPESGIVVCADRERISEVLNHLIGNALRFTQGAGQVTVEITETEKEVECSVADTGIGISEKDLGKVFSKFQQFGRVPGSGEKGTGLGLSIAKNIVEMHQGRIRVESKPGTGTKFTFTLPKTAPEELFKEYVNNAKLESRKLGPKKSLMVVSLIHFDQLKRELPPGKAQNILKELENSLKNSLQGEGDLVIKDTGTVAVVLVHYDEKDSLAVKGKLWQVLEDSLARQELGHKIILRFGDKYPDEAQGDKV